MNTTAQKIAAFFDDDGTCFEKDELTIDAKCRDSGSSVEHDGELWRYEFEDESAITGNAEGWDIEGTHYFVMSGADQE